ncbi:MAG: hypothetical protein ACRCZ2_00525 [Fusobacteriaceae bacterium]
MGDKYYCFTEDQLRYFGLTEGQIKEMTHVENRVLTYVTFVDFVDTFRYLKGIKNLDSDNILDIIENASDFPHFDEEILELYAKRTLDGLRSLEYLGRDFVDKTNNVLILNKTLEEMS